jgi:4-amino-4-deoxy-L-arabinose transferase-like glycosyltransferase
MDRDAPPPSLTGWICQLWSGFLFPGPSTAAAGPPRLGRLALLVVLPGLLLYPCLDFRLFEPDESRYAQIPREMLERGDWLVPVLQGEPYLDKPPLFYWLVMLSYRLFGCHDWAARLVPAAAVHLTILLTYLLGRRTLGDRPALVGALLLALAPGFVGTARLLLLDGLLTLFVSLAVLAAFEATRGPTFRRGWWLVAGAACGLGVLTKGPVALLLLVPPLFFYRALSRRGSWPGTRAWLAFAAVVLAVALPWYVALGCRLPGFVGYFFWEHNVKRFLAPQMHARGVWFYAPVVALLLLPGTLLAVPLARFLLTGDPATARRRSAELGFHVLVGGWVVLFFTLSSCKLPTYVLPALPFLALVLGYSLVQTGWDASRPARLAAGASLALVLVGHYAALPWYARYRSPMSRPAEVLALCADHSTPVVCYPRNCDSVAFYLGRSDLRTYRSKEIEELRTLVRTRPRTVILCTHRHSLAGLKELLPPEVRIAREVRLGLADIPGVPRWLMRPLARLMGETALGLSDLAVVEMPGLLGAAKRQARAQNELSMFRYDP